MVEVDLNHIYKKYEGNDKYSVNDFDLIMRRLKSRKDGKLLSRSQMIFTDIL